MCMHLINIRKEGWSRRRMGLGIEEKGIKSLSRSQRCGFAVADRLGRRGRGHQKHLDRFVPQVCCCCLFWQSGQSGCMLLYVFSQQQAVGLASDIKVTFL